jgi:mono/diheme cytochrome c family protein
MITPAGTVARKRRRSKRWLYLLAALAGVGGYLGWSALVSGPRSERLSVIVPELSAVARSGRDAFGRHCAQCHGGDAGGTASGPPLVHRVYRPAHHADVAFELAMRRGVVAHHWRFGNMPPTPVLTATDIDHITRYVRELQRANGID